MDVRPVPLSTKCWLEAPWGGGGEQVGTLGPATHREQHTSTAQRYTPRGGGVSHVFFLRQHALRMRLMNWNQRGPFSLFRLALSCQRM